MDSKEFLQDLLKRADIKINGRRKWDIRVHDDRLYDRVVSGGSLALGESYMDGWWDVPRLDMFFDRLLGSQLDAHSSITPRVVLMYLRNQFFNLQTSLRAKKSIAHHYDIGNDLYEAMLDPTMTYSCGYWANAKTLEEAQLAKYEIICKKIGLKKGMKVLDIGCGWGGFATYAAKKGAKVVAITLSKEQAKLAKERVPKGVTVRIQDYRDVEEQFDRIVSIGMFEHVGPKNYRTYFEVARRCLREDGLFLLHTIGRSKTSNNTDPWIATYIFPNSSLPSPVQITEGTEDLFVLEDWHNFGTDYDKTLMAWHKNVEANKQKLSPNYDERFFRMWDYYLLACAGSFRCRKNQLWQLVLSPKGVEGGYRRPL